MMVGIQAITTMGIVPSAIQLLPLIKEVLIRNNSKLYTKSAMLTTEIQCQHKHIYASLIKKPYIKASQVFDLAGVNI